MMKKKAVVSACLLGHICRYDGKSKRVSEVEKGLSDYEIVPFCPEAPLFGTPRERISVVNVDGIHKIITDETKKDVTLLLKEEIKSFLELHPDISRVVLKSKSPSCGVGTTPILNSKKEKIALGNGIAGDIFTQELSKLELEDESSFL
jgi:uncharacterized protein YbbK (DUF523 family)